MSRPGPRSRDRADTARLGSSRVTPRSGTRSPVGSHLETKPSLVAPRRIAPRWIAPLTILLVALGVRLIYLGQIRPMGFFHQRLSDAEVYDQRARGIAEGDWLGPPDFVHAPSYAYYLGILRVLGGDRSWTPRIVQVVGGAAACVLVYLTCRRLFGGPSACVAGALLALFPPAIFFDGLIQKTSLALLLSALLLYLAVRGADRPRWWLWGLAGIVLGLLILTRQNALSLVPLFAAWVWLATRGPEAAPVPAGTGEGADWPAPRRPTARQRAVWVLAAAAGLVVMLFPWAARNRVVTGEWVLTTPNLGQNFAMGNHPQATGTYLPFKRGRATGVTEQAEWVKAAEQAVGRPLSPREVSDYYFNSGLEWVKSNPGAWLKLTCKKVLMVWGAYEAPDTEDYYGYQEHAAVLRWLDPGLHFGVLAPVAVAGLWLTRGRWRQLWLLYGWLALTTLAVAAFVVFARYRFPLVPVLVMFAAAGLVEGLRCVRQRRYRALGTPLVLLVVGAVATNYPVHHARRPYTMAYSNHAAVLRGEGRYDESLAELAKALKLAPQDVDTHYTAGTTLLDLGRFAEALQHFELARAGDPQYAAAYRGAGDALSGLARVDEAAEQCSLAVALDPTDHMALNCLAVARARQGRLAEALDLFRQVLALVPDDPGGYLNVGNAYLVAGRLDEAAAAYQQALALRADYADALHNLGLIESQRGNAAATLEYFERAVTAAPGRTDVERDYLVALIRGGQAERALQEIDVRLQADPGRADLRALRAEALAAAQSP